MTSLSNIVIILHLQQVPTLVMCLSFQANRSGVDVEADANGVENEGSARKDTSKAKIIKTVLLYHLCSLYM